MYHDLRVAAVVPAYKEQDTSPVIETMPDLVDHIVIVDDASPDATTDAARAAADAALSSAWRRTRASAAHHDRPQGRAGPRRRRLRRDGRRRPDGPRLPARPARPDRRRTGPVHQGQPVLRPWLVRGHAAQRVFGNIVLSFLTKASSGYWNLFDPQNGYTAIHRTRSSDAAGPDRAALRVRERPAHQPQHPAGPGRRRAGARRYGAEVSGMNLATVGPRIASRLFRGFWPRMWWKYVLQSFSAVALLFFSGLGPALLRARRRRLDHRQHPRPARWRARHGHPLRGSRCSAGSRCCSSRCSSTSRSRRPALSPLRASRRGHPDHREVGDARVPGADTRLRRGREHHGPRGVLEEGALLRDGQPGLRGTHPRLGHAEDVEQAPGHRVGRRGAAEPHDRGLRARGSRARRRRGTRRRWPRCRPGNPRAAGARRPRTPRAPRSRPDA